MTTGAGVAAVAMAALLGLGAGGCGADDGTVPSTDVGEGTDGGVQDREDGGTTDPEVGDDVDERRTDATDGTGGGGAGPSDGAPDDSSGDGVIGSG
jgi:hypothetical protein